MEMVKCQKCGHEISRDDGFTRGEQILCEDCYLNATHRLQTCDPFAVRSAKLFRKTSGLEATEGLTELQRAMCEFMKSRGKVTREELSSKFHLSPQQLENQIAILRHCELVKGQKEGNKVYLTPF
jgi:predicted HTH transcriptional regulator